LCALTIKTEHDIENIRQLQVPSGSGAMVPFTELADIDYTEGPAKISRDNTHRRVVVSINVRNRDLQSVINDIQQKISSQYNPGLPEITLNTAANSKT
jgi:heavy metal efflux system protein